MRTLRLLLRWAHWVLALAAMLALPSLASASATNEITPLNLPHFEPELPSAPGRGAFMVVCVSCHSARYVTMQPLFPEQQWKDTVDKMVKVYGAIMDTQQRLQIVQYLVAVHGPASSSAGPAADDDFGVPASPADASSAPPALQLAATPEEISAQTKVGAELFQQNCAGCHGAEGKGDGWVANIFLRKPKDLSATRFSPAALSEALWNGKPGTAMPSWRALSRTNLNALAAYVLTLYRAPETDAGVVPTSAVLLRGQTLFQQNCAACHGTSGEGNGPAAATLTPAPANFKLKQPNPDYLLQVLDHGVPGTGMPAWGAQISAPDRRALAAFVRSLFATPSGVK